MTNSLFSEQQVREYYDGVVTQQAERRIFNIPNEDLCAGSTKNHVDAIVTMLCPGRIILDSTIQESSDGESSNGRMVLRTWLEFTGSARLLTLRPRQYYSTPPYVTRVIPSSGGAAGRILTEKVLSSSEDFKEYKNFADEQFKKVIDYVPWVNEDLDYYEQSVRNWLWTLLEAKRKRLCPETAQEHNEYSRDSF
jgi:hypothetical protein